MIHPKPGDEGRAVIYGRLDPHRTTEFGTISSWNYRYVFVRYSAGSTGSATEPEDLEWYEDVPSGTEFDDRTSGELRRRIRGDAHGDRE